MIASSTRNNSKTRKFRKGKVWAETLIPLISKKAEEGLSQKEIAQWAGVSGSCFSGWLQRYPKLAEAFHAARTRFCEAELTKIRDSIGDGWRGSARILSEMFPDEFGDPDETDLGIDVVATCEVVIDGKTVKKESARTSAAHSPFRHQTFVETASPKQKKPPIKLV